VSEHDHHNEHSTTSGAVLTSNDTSGTSGGVLVDTTGTTTTGTAAPAAGYDSDDDSNERNEHSGSGEHHSREHGSGDDSGHEEHHHGASGSGGVLVSNDPVGTTGPAVVLVGSGQSDILNGGDVDNVLNAGDGNDILVTGSASARGHNHADGGRGDDIMVAGGTGTHHFHGFLAQRQDIATLVSTDANLAGIAAVQNAAVDDIGAGAENVFEFHTDSGNDLILNFHAGDRLQIDRGVNGSDIRDLESLARHLNVSGDNVSVDLGNGNSVTLVGVDVAAMSAANFVLV
jgi:hypothetical protein